MPGPIDPLTNQTNPFVAQEYMAWRKRLREARARYIDEVECPTAHTVTTKDATGKEVTFSTGFQVGKRTYEGEYPQTAADAFKPTFLPEDKPLTFDQVQADLQPILEEVERFLAPGIYRESAHPEMREGESNGDYCTRVGRDYEQATGADAIRRPVPDSDSVREPADTHPSGQRGASAPGASDSQPGRAHPGGDADQDDRGGAQPGDAGGAGNCSDPSGANDADSNRIPPG